MSSKIISTPTFITPEECSNIIKIITDTVSSETTTEPTWEYHPWGRVQIDNKIRAKALKSSIRRHDLYHTEIIVRCIQQHVSYNFKSLQDRISDKIKLDHKCGDIYPEYTILQAGYEGDNCPRHSDSKKYDDATGRWIPNHTPNHFMSVCLYINECGVDYTGGELVFPEYDIRIQPSTGLLISFPSDELHEHLVTQITSGVRYAILCWFTNKVEYMEKL